MKPKLLLSLLALACAASTAAAQPAPTYWQDIRPVFRKHCTVCHSSRYLKKVDVSGGLALDTFDVAIKGSKQPVVTPGKSDASLLVQYMTTTDVKKRMPLDAEPLPKEAIALIRRWIDGGAKEGKRDDGDETVISTAPKGPTRKLDALIATASGENKAVPAKAQLSLKVGPLAPVAAVAFSPDGKLLAAGSYGQVVVWDMDRVQPVKRLTNVLGAVNDLKFSPDGSLLAVAGGQPSAKGDLRLYQTSDWKLVATLRGHDDVIFSVSFDKDGGRLVSASFDHSLRLWDVKTHASLRAYHHHSDFVYAAAFAPSGKQIASASKDRTVQLFDADTGKGVFTFSGMEQDALAVAVSPDGKSVVSSGFEPGIWWWNPQTGEKVKVQGGHGTAVHELAFSKDGKRLVSAGADRTIRTWDGATGAPLKTIAAGSIVYAVAVSPNGKLIAGGSFDGLVRLWDEATGKHLVTLLALPGDNDAADWLAVTPAGPAVGSDALLAQARWWLGAKDAPVPREADAVRQALKKN